MQKVIRSAKSPRIRAWVAVKPPGSGEILKLLRELNTDTYFHAPLEVFQYEANSSNKNAGSVASQQSTFNRQIKLKVSKILHKTLKKTYRYSWKQRIQVATLTSKSLLLESILNLLSQKCLIFYMKRSKIRKVANFAETR